MLPSRGGWPARRGAGGRDMARVLCDEVGEGLRSSEKTVVVRDVQGHRHHLRVESDYLTEQGGKHYLPVGVVHRLPERQLVLIELPQEADSGANRLWVRSAEVADGVEAPA